MAIIFLKWLFLLHIAVPQTQVILERYVYRLPFYFSIILTFYVLYQLGFHTV
jgi:hypothetical protein